MRIAIQYGKCLAVGWLVLLSCGAARGQAPSTQPQSTQAPRAQATPKPASPVGELGSTMTLEGLQAKTKQAAAKVQKPIEVRSAAEPVPALKYRFAPEMHELKPGSALLHFSRAMLRLDNLRRDQRFKLVLGPDEPAPSTEEAERLISEAALIFDDLHQLALSEDFGWDHRMRDLRGPAIWAYTLPDVQESRALARLLQRHIHYQLDRGQFDGAVRSIGDGFRLGEFVSTGETLIHQLVGVAIQELMRDAAQTAVTKPGCPNLYWALASVPDRSQQMQRALEFELNSFDITFEMLPEAESKNADEQYWQSRLQDLLISLRQLGAHDNDLSFSITVAAMTASTVAKDQLIAAGWKKDDVEAMPPTRALLINTRRELLTLAQQVEKLGLIPYPLAADVSQRVMGDLDRWTREKRYTSLGASIASLLFPSINSVRVAVVRRRFQHNRLMAVEALRMHAANHQGQLPKSLSDLDPLPAPLDPFSNEPFEYRAKATDDGVLIELSGKTPPQFDRFKRLNVHFKDATLAPE